MATENIGTSGVFTIKFSSNNEAQIAMNSLQVDSEPSRSRSKKTLSVSSETLIVKIFSPDVRELRISVNSFMDHLHLVNQTIERFGPQSES